MSVHYFHFLLTHIMTPIPTDNNSHVAGSGTGFISLRTTHAPVVFLLRSTPINDKLPQPPSPGSCCLSARNCTNRFVITRFLRDLFYVNSGQGGEKRHLITKQMSVSIYFSIFNSITLQFVIKGCPAHAERASGLGLVPVDLVQRFQDFILF